MKCSCEGCSQIVIDPDEQKKEQPLCYFHAKQRDGLIPIEDREYYLSATDMQEMGQDLQKAKGWSQFGLRYRPWVFKTAYKLAYKSGMNAVDLAQEGLSFAWSLGTKVDTSRPIAEQISYFKQSVRGHILNYIRQRLEETAGMDVQESLNPEEILIQKETEQDHSDMVCKVSAFNQSLSRKERIVFQKLMIAKHPMTTRELAKKLKVRSNKTITNIRDRIVEKAKGFFYESTDCKVCGVAGRSQEDTSSDSSVQS